MGLPLKQEVRVVYVEDKGDDFDKRRRRRHSSGDRETWSRKVEYFFASLGYAVGLGNIWRFPYLCYRNGGGAFLIPYILALCMVGFPIMFMEMAFGQFASLGPITIWKICPIFKGIGYTIVTVLLLVNTYYNVLIAYALFYLFASITSELPWSRCDNKWNTNACIIERYDPSKVNTSELLVNGTGEAYNFTTTRMPFIDKSLLKTPTEEFFERHLLARTSGIHDLGDVRWPLVICLVVSWGTCFMCLFKGIKSMGKVVIVTTIFSYIILTVLLIRGVTLPGSMDGIIFYLKPEWEALGRLEVWGEASAQAVASLTLGGGGWITLSSYNRFYNRCDRDTILIGLGNAVTSIYSGFVIFSVLGYMAHIKGVPVKDVTEKGPGLAFVAYPEGISLIPGAPFWAVAFFLMMFTVGLDSLFGQVETIAAGIIDEYPNLLRPRRRLFTLCLCIFMFLLGIPLTTQGGIYIVTLMDWYTLLFSFSLISLTEIIVIIYIYGYNRFAEDIEMMVGHKPSKYYMVMWMGVSPLAILCIVAFLAARYIPAYYGSYRFPPFAESIGWALAFLPLTIIPIYAIIQFFIKARNFSTVIGFFRNKTIRQDLINALIYPALDWGPSLPDIRRKFSYGGRLGSTKDDEDGGLPNVKGDEEDVFGDDPEQVALKQRNESGKSSNSDKAVRFHEHAPEEIGDKQEGENLTNTVAEKGDANV